VPTIEHDRALDALVARTERTLEQVGDAFPLFADPDTGSWETTADGNWCGGHWVGLLWIAARRAETEREYARLSRVARERAERVREAMSPRTHFCGMNFHHAGFEGYDATGDRSLFALGLAGADAMASLFDERARQVPVGTFRIEGGDSFEGSTDESIRFRTTAVDAVHTALPVLWRAFEETNDPRFRDVAVSHADRHLDWLVEADGRTWHHAVFDPATGRLSHHGNELAHSDETCWARGHGWNVAGLARAYDETGAERYLDALERSVAYYREHTPDDLVPHWDLRAPAGPDTPRDTSAAALVAFGLSRLAGSDGRVAELRATGLAVLDSVVASYTVLDEADDRYGMVREGCYDGPGEYATAHELVWTDYYVAQTLARLLSSEDPSPS
jgi:unsaturated chondroitin disaccharide hydrolase